MLGLHDTLKRRAEVVAQPTGDGAVLVDMVDGRCWELNRTGALLWSALATPATVGHACDELRARYQVAADVAERDVLALAAELMKAGLVEVVSPPAEPPPR